MAVPSIVMVHGAGGGGWQWRLWQAVLESNGWDVYAPDLAPAAGGLAATQWSDYVAQVVDWIGDCGAPAPFVIGASMGGLLAMAAAEHCDCSGIILVNAIPPRSVAGWPPAQATFAQVIPWATQTTLEETLAALPDRGGNEETVRGEAWRDESGAVMAALYRGIEVAAPRVPLLVVAGAADETVPARFAAAMAEQYRADLLTLSGVSHLGALLGKRAELIAAMAAQWLEAVWVESGAADTFEEGGD